MDGNIGLALRPAVAADQMMLEALQWRAALGWDEYRDALMAHTDAIELPLAQIEAGQVWVAEQGGAMMGFCVVAPRADGQAELDGLFVEPGSWRKGVGRILVAQAQDAARGQGAAWLHVVANPLALGFYRACGFELLGRCDTQFGLGLTMRKVIGG
jgi:GNAT superfamily N-acetyltransferase